MGSGDAVAHGSVVPALWSRRPTAPAAAPRVDTREGFRAFYDSALPEVFRYLVRRCDGDRSLAEDLTQEVFLTAARVIRDGRPDTVCLPWLITVAQSRFVDHVRRRQRDQRNLAVAWQAVERDDVRAWQQQRERREVLDVLATLPPAQRDALALFYVDDLTVAQAAQRLGRSVHATESLLARGRDGLRKRFAEEVRGA